MIDAAAVAVIGFHALLGVLRAFSGFVVDSFTRLAAMMIKRQLPPGLADMSERASYLTPWQIFGPHDAAAIAANFDGDGRGDSHEFAVLTGFASRAFEGRPNDLVVALDSAWAGTGQGPQVEATCTHFGFLQDDIVRNFLNGFV